MIYGVFGPRDVRGQEYTNYEYIARCLEQVPHLNTVVVGGGKGVESLVERWASLAHGVNSIIVPPSLRVDHITAARAFDLRNLEIIQQSDACVIFWDGVFAATFGLIAQGIICKKQMIVFPLE